MPHKVRIIQKSWLTHDVMQFKLSKPHGYKFIAGQAIEASLDQPEFKDVWSPFTFTSLSTDDLLELTIKMYPDHKGLTLALSKLNDNDQILITDPFTTFKNNGPGVFIAGGTGITPFIALIRQMYVDGEVAGSTLFFANKTGKDIFLADEFRKMLGDKFINILSREQKNPYLHGHVDKAFLQKHISNFNQPFYLCGPDNFAEDISACLKESGASAEMVNLST